VVVHVSNPSYSGNGNGRITVQGQSEQKKKKVSEILSQKISQAWWCITINSAMQEAKVKGSQS
jgi:hypothetical protein